MGHLERVQTDCTFLVWTLARCNIVHWIKRIVVSVRIEGRREKANVRTLYVEIEICGDPFAFAFTIRGLVDGFLPFTFAIRVASLIE